MHFLESIFENAFFLALCTIFKLLFFLQIFMWGQCHGLTLLSPRQVAVANLEEVFACFGMPQIMFKPVKLGLYIHGFFLHNEIAFMAWRFN